MLYRNRATGLAPLPEQLFFGISDFCFISVPFDVIFPFIQALL